MKLRDFEYWPWLERTIYKRDKAVPKYFYVRNKEGAVRGLYLFTSGGVFLTPMTLNGRPATVRETMDDAELDENYVLSGKEMDGLEALECLKKLVKRDDYITSHVFSLRHDEKWVSAVAGYV